MKDIARVGNTFLTWEDFYENYLCDITFRWENRLNGAKAICGKGDVFILISDEEFQELSLKQIPKTIINIKQNLKIP